MAGIFHRVRVRASTSEVFRAVTEDELLRPWWAGDGRLAVRCLGVVDGAHVAWRCIDGPPEWVDTEIAFVFVRDGSDTIVRFAHTNWREVTDAFARCTTKWGRVLLALKSTLETPEGDDLEA
jgi:hypothetical protein